MLTFGMESITFPFMMSEVTDKQLSEAAADRIFARRDSILHEQREIRENQVRLAARERELDRALSECRAAARFFGLQGFDPPANEQQIANLKAIIESYRRRYEMMESRGDG